MLILSRKTGQAVYLDDTTEIRILDIRGGRDRVGISAPRSVTISRGIVQTAHPATGAANRDVCQFFENGMRKRWST